MYLSILTQFIALICSATALRCLSCPDFNCYSSDGKVPDKVECNDPGSACWSVSRPDDHSRTQTRLCARKELMNKTAAKIGECTILDGVILKEIEEEIDRIIGSASNAGAGVRMGRDSGGIPAGRLAAQTDKKYLQCACDQDLCDNAKEREDASSKSGSGELLAAEVRVMIIVSSSVAVTSSLLLFLWSFGISI